MMPDVDYGTKRDLNGIFNLIPAVIFLTMGAWLIWRGGHERPWWRPIPGRIVIGLAIVCYFIARIEESIRRIIAGPGVGQVGPHINDWNTIALLVVASVLSVWALVRVVRNDVETSRPE